MQIEDIKTGVQGHPQIKSFKMPISSPNEQMDISFAYPIRLIKGWFADNYGKGNEVKLLLAKNTPIGVTQSNALAGSNEIYIQSPDRAFKSVKTQNEPAEYNVNCYLPSVGYIINVAGQDLAQVISVDKETGKITTEKALTADIPAITPILQSIIIADYTFSGTDTVVTLEGGIGSKLISANSPLTIEFKNTENYNGEFVFNWEFYY